MRRWNEKEKLAGLFCLLVWLLAGWVYFVHLPLERARASARRCPSNISASAEKWSSNM